MGSFSDDRSNCRGLGRGVVGISSADSEASTEAYFDAGLTYGVGDDLQFDTGTNLGLTEASEDVRFFVGVSIRH